LSKNLFEGENEEENGEEEEDARDEEENLHASV
jgi:hypothetical protein